MNAGLSWLPPLIMRGGRSDGDFVDEARAAFLPYWSGSPLFDGVPLVLLPNGFEHIITKDTLGPGSPRELDDARCERALWAAAILERASDEVLVRRWGSAQDRRRVLLAPRDFSYLVVVERRPAAAILITGFPLILDHERAKKQRECTRYMAAATKTKKGGGSPPSCPVGS